MVEETLKLLLGVYENRIAVSYDGFVIASKAISITVI